MNVVDNFAKNHYSWIQQYIQLDCLSTDINLQVPGAELTEAGDRNTSLLVHEYIHYLQNFATYWGTWVCTALAFGYLKVGASSATSAETYQLPLKKENVTNAPLRGGLGLLELVKARLGQSDSTVPVSGGSLRPITVSIGSDIVALSNGLLNVQVGMKVIRESMAHTGTSLYLGRSDDELHQFNGLISKKTSTTAAFVTAEEYWIVFEYFYGRGKYTNVARGVFDLMQYALCTLRPDRTVGRFFRFLTASGTETSLPALVWAFQVTPTEQHISADAQQRTLKHCQDALDVCNKHQDNHALFEFALAIINYTVEGITASNGGRVFDPADDFHDFDYWREKIRRYGSGLIKFRDRSMINGTEDHCKKMHTPFTYLLSVGVVLEKLVGNNILQCPILHEFNICRVGYRDGPGCHSNPFTVINPDPAGDQCVFRNGFLLLGMQDRIQF